LTVVQVTLVPHTHWDREWYEPFDVFVERLVSMMDTLLDLVGEGFPHFHLDGQTAMIDDYLERRPDRADELAARVREGRLSAGPWVTQMDEFLVSGESHVRNLRMGLERARALGAEPRVGYLPDQFGHIGQMPRILSDAGLEWALVWRGVPAAIDRSTFRWRSTDGAAEVLCEYMPFGYSAGARLMQAHEPEALAATIRAEVERMRPFLVDDRLLIMVGYDHAGPDATLPDRLARAGPWLNGIEARIGGIDQHVEGRRLGELPVWTGELRSGARAHLLPNVVSARVHQKLERGRVETLIERHVEPVAGPDPASADELRRAWTLLLWNGAHDSACGCSHDRVAEDVDARFAEARAIAEALLSRAGEGSPPAPEDAGDAGDVPLTALPDGVEMDGTPLRFADEPDVGDLYTFCPAPEGHRAAPPHTVTVDGDRFEAEWDGLRIAARVTRPGGGPVLVVDGAIANDRPDHRLRIHVVVPPGATSAVAGAPFELVERPLVGEGSEGEAPSPTWPARHVVMVSGTAVLHEGVFEYEVVKGRELAVTLLRCVGTISRESLATRPYPAGPATPTPNAQMIGSTSFRLGVWPGADEAMLSERWDRFALASARRRARPRNGTPSPR
jgi:alpha-mannosidase